MHGIYAVKYLLSTSIRQLIGKLCEKKCRGPIGSLCENGPILKLRTPRHGGRGILCIPSTTSEGKGNLTKDRNRIIQSVTVYSTYWLKKMLSRNYLTSTLQGCPEESQNQPATESK